MTLATEEARRFIQLIRDTVVEGMVDIMRRWAGEVVK